MAAYIGISSKLDQGFADHHGHLPLAGASSSYLGVGFPTGYRRWPYGFDLGAVAYTAPATGCSAQLPQPPLQKLLDGQVSRFKVCQNRFKANHFSGHQTCHCLGEGENNSKQYIKEGRFDKTQQPAGDLTAKWGILNAVTIRIVIPPTTPTKRVNPEPAYLRDVGEFYWGYATQHCGHQSRRLG